MANKDECVVGREATATQLLLTPTLNNARLAKDFENPP